MIDSNFTASRLFKGLPDSVKEQIFHAGDIRRIKGGTYILTEGKIVDRLYVVLSGAVEVLLGGARDTLSSIKLADFGPGDFFGEYAFVDGGPASASVRATGDIVVHVIPHETLHAYLDNHPDIKLIVYENLMDVLVDRLRASNAELDLLAFRI